MSLIIKNATVVDPKNSINGSQDIYIENGKIVGKLSSVDGAQTIDGTGKFLIPGLVDLRARFREPGQEHKANIRKEAQAAAKAGVTSVCIPPDTDPVIDRPSMIQMLIEKGKLSGGAKIYPLAALTNGLAGESLADMWSLKTAGGVGVSNATQAVPNALVMRRAMQYAASFDLRIHLYAQDHSLAGNGCVHEGLNSTRLGLPAIPPAAEIVGVAREIALIETTGAKAHFMGLSCARSVEMIAAAQARGLDITADVDIHHLAMCEDDMADFDSNYFILPPLRTQADQAALIDGVNADVITAICSDHQPHDRDAKLAPFSESEPGISGIEHLLPLALELVAQNKIDMNTLVKAITSAPADILGIEAGNLNEGASADLCIVEKRNNSLTEAGILSSGKNSPYIGKELSFCLEKTFIDGQVI